MTKNNKYENVDLSTLSDDELLEACEIARSNVHYYNAAEGNWRSETKSRKLAYDRLDQIHEEVSARNL